ncbi:glycosyltransferase family 9 protein [Alteromonas ponticola]|uniref:Lipopolysaccharide heptosyltransferase family protein n=1 Tax=Alteromonas ponticola TaxID=2720613 RepID=A0ABX1QZK9_9ALTE|nr:hypothetical protein [Alteromonas ponticola]NMH59657.1 hypothetical protein [Alteromonas ponticola]
MAEKILVIRMMESFDVAAIGVPAIRHLKRCFPEADIHCLTFGQGSEIVRLAEPDVTVLDLAQADWPEDFVAAMEVFLELAEIINSYNYTEIINLDTWFMPCFMARFLKDAGEPVIGNTLNRSVQDIIDDFKHQSLSADYVNSPEQYLQSTWTGMHSWFENWWLHGEPPEGGYPEFYLRRCCGFADINMDISIDVDAEKMIESQPLKTIALALSGASSTECYPFSDELARQLTARDFKVYSGLDDEAKMQEKLSKLKACDLLVSIPAGAQWLAAAVNTPVLLISGRIDPQTIMPDYATEMSDQPVSVESLVEGIIQIIEGKANA